MKDSKVILIVAALITAGCVAFAVWFVGRPKGAVPASDRPAQASAPITAGTASYVGRAACAACHQAETEQWAGSHHDKAMEEATAANVRGDFNDASFTYHAVTSTFSKKGDEFWVRTDGPDGKLTDYKIAYSFGIYPLQQYLIEFPGGRYQALNVCWDTRPKDQGGQRWFHLYPNEDVAAGDILHWTGPYQNWNHMCAECHSTNVHKNASADGESFKTSWSELDVSCESCHGPGSEHVTWAKRATAGLTKGQKPPPSPPGATKGFVALLREEKPAMWMPDPATGIAKRDIPRTSRVEAQTCARCHSRRGTFNEDVLPGMPPADTHRLALLEPTLYEADGQIKDEVYEYQSFIQSRMYAAGVTCSDCHNPHSLKVAPGNDACNRCHSPEKFDTPAHTNHNAKGNASACIACHMPTKTYMVVHDRHDHSMRVPRPDLTVTLGTPNACNGCHTDKTPQWAADAITKWTPGKERRPHYANALAAGRRGTPEAEALLTKLLADPTQPVIVRATAIDLLAAAANQGAVVAALSDADPLMRAAAVQSLNRADGAALARQLAPLLSDPVRQVRMDAARRLATAPDTLFTPQQLAARSRAMDEYMAAQQLDADRAESHLNLGALHVERREFDAAEREYLLALKLSPHFPAAYVNLGDLYRGLRREDDAVRVLRDGLARAPGSADIPHSLGLAMVRAGKVAEALPLLERAATLAPDVTRYAYVYGVALESAGPPGRGIDVLKRAHERHPGDGEVLEALVSYCYAIGKRDEALSYAYKLAALRPGDPQVRGMVEQLRGEQGGGGGLPNNSSPR